MSRGSSVDTGQVFHCAGAIARSERDNGTVTERRSGRITAADFQKRFPGGVGVLVSSATAQAALSEIAPVGAVFFLVFERDGVHVWSDPSGEVEFLALPWSAVGTVDRVDPEQRDPLDRSFTADLLGLSFDYLGHPIDLQVEVRRGLSTALDATMDAYDLVQLVRKIDGLRGVARP